MRVSILRSTDVKKSNSNACYVLFMWQKPTEVKQIPKQKKIGEQIKTRKIFINNKIQLCAEKVRFKMTEQHKSKRLCSCSAVWHTEHVTSTACKRNKTFTTHQANKLSIANHKKCPSISPYRIIMLLFIGFPGLNTGKLSCFFLLIVFFAVDRIYTFICKAAIAISGDLAKYNNNNHYNRKKQTKFAVVTIFIHVYQFYYSL